MLASTVKNRNNVASGLLDVVYAPPPFSSRHWLAYLTLLLPGWDLQLQRRAVLPEPSTELLLRAGT